MLSRAQQKLPVIRARTDLPILRGVWDEAANNLSILGQTVVFGGGQGVLLGYEVQDVALSTQQVSILLQDPGEHLSLAEVAIDPVELLAGPPASVSD